MWLYNPNGFFKRKIRESDVWEQTWSRGREGRGQILGTFHGGRGCPHGQDSGGGSTPSVAAPQMQAQKGQMGPEAMLIQDKTPRGKCMSERPCRTLQVQIPFGV